MKTGKTSNATQIIRQEMLGDSELATLVEEERRRLALAERIREARQEAGLSQAELGALIGTTQSAVARLESGEYERLSLSTLIKVSTALGRRLKIELEPAEV